jgi:hypothetical protein
MCERVRERRVGGSTGKEECEAEQVAVPSLISIPMPIPNEEVQSEFSGTVWLIRKKRHVRCSPLPSYAKPGTFCHSGQAIAWNIGSANMVQKFRNDLKILARSLWFATGSQT